MTETPEYQVTMVERDFSVPGKPSFWDALPVALINHYLWLDNGYRPRVEVRACYSQSSLYFYFKAFESRVKARLSQFQDPVYKDSCVELFINPFPEKPIGYVNLEANALGTVLAAVGPDRHRRMSLVRGDMEGFRIVSSINEPVEGSHGAEYWTLEYRFPLEMFRKIYGGGIVPGQTARANFYKCGDETERPHYGAWSPVESDRPDFHRPEFFGRLLFS